MSDQSAPRVESARFVIPFEADVSEVESALDRLGDKADEIVAKIRSAFDQRQESIGEPIASAAGVESGRVRDFTGGEPDGNQDLVEEVKRNTEAVTELRDAIEALTEAVSSINSSEEL